MAYEKHIWECGDKITADLLNHIEEGIEDAGSGADVGYSCTEIVLTEESLTAEEIY